MSRLLVVLLSSFLVLPALADQIYFYVESNPPAYGDPGLVVTYKVVVRNTQEPAARDITVTIPLPPGQLLQVSPQHPDWKCSSSAAQVVCTRESLPVTDFRTDQPIMITVKLSDDRRGMRFNELATVTAAPGTQFINSEASVFALLNALFSVSSSADSGPGTLRAVIEQTNEACRGNIPCKVTFDLPPYTTIEPLTPLPSVTGCELYFFGRQRQVGDRPIELSGARLTSGSGLELHSSCQGLIDIEDLAINRFPDYGILIGEQSYSVRLSGLYVGTDVTGTEFRPNTRGIGVFHGRGGGFSISGSIISGNRRSGLFVWNGFLNIQGTRIEHNGASGVFQAFGNLLVQSSTIAHNGEFGIAVSPAIDNLTVVEGSIHSNGITGIDWGLDGSANTNPRIPPPGRITDAYFDEAKNATIVTGTFPRESIIGPLYGVQVWASRALNPSGNAEGERWVGTMVGAELQPDGSFVFRAEVREDLRGQIVTVTVGSSPWLDTTISFTTEFSAGVTVR